MKIVFIATLGVLSLIQPSLSFADNANGKNLFLQRCAMCHGADLKGTGPLAHRSNPPTPDLTTPAFKKRLSDYPGVIVSSVILRPNGDLIPRTLRDNGVKVPPHAWTVNDFRDLNQYMSGAILKKLCFLNSNPSINYFVICQVDGDNPRKTSSLTERACEGLY